MSADVSGPPHGQAPIGLNAVILITSRFDSMVDFYANTLGLTMSAGAENYAFFELGSQVLGIFERGHHAEGDRRLGGADHGISHLEFCIPSVDRPAAEEMLQSAGAQAYRDNFEDPDGNLFHFVDV